MNKFLIFLGVFALIFTSFAFAEDDVSIDSEVGTQKVKKHQHRPCKKNPDSDECLARKEKIKTYCAENPSAPKCNKLKKHGHKYCHENPDDERCIATKEKIKAHCEANPDDDRCKRAGLHRLHHHCRENPDDEKCLAAKDKICEKYPNANICLE